MASLMPNLQSVLTTQTVKGTYLFPRWLVVMFLVCFGITLLCLGTAFYYYRKNQNTEATMNRYVRHYNRFLKEHPEAETWPGLGLVGERKITAEHRFVR